MLPDEARQRAIELRAFAEGLSGPGAERVRMAANDLVQLCDDLASYRSALATLRARYDDALNIIGQAAYQACVDEAEAQRPRHA